MKTTIDISDALLREAKQLAKARSITLRELVERGLKLAMQQEAAPPVRYEPVVFGGQGISPEYGDWEAVRETIYDGRGS